MPEAQAAIKGMNGQNFGGRDLVVNEARPDGTTSPRSGGRFLAMVAAKWRWRLRRRWWRLRRYVAAAIERRCGPCIWGQLIFPFPESKEPQALFLGFETS